MQMTEMKHQLVIGEKDHQITMLTISHEHESIRAKLERDNFMLKIQVLEMQKIH